MIDPRRDLPSVDRLLRVPSVEALLEETPRGVVVSAIRTVLHAARQGETPPPDDWSQAILDEVGCRTDPSLKPVINATGVVLHTNLGRAPLAPDAIAAVQQVAQGYSTLEYDLDSGTRGSRTEHCRSLLVELTGAEDALVVNNAAGALALALNAAAEGKEVLISRGELIEIGGSFRIPDILEKSGARLREVGTTNRTHRHDYETALGPDTGAILTVHQSNFQQTGFVASPDPAGLGSLAGSHGVPYLYDVGSGLLIDLSPWGLRGEPRVQDALASGATAVVFSGDKLLGGPQAGCLVGATGFIERCRVNPLARALRADKFTLSALAATLAHYHDGERARDSIPVLRMLTADPADLAALAGDLATACPAQLDPRLMPGESAVGGGAFPEAHLPTTLVVLSRTPNGPQDFCRKLRTGTPPVIARVADDVVLLDPRTIPRGRFADVRAALERALE